MPSADIGDRCELGERVERAVLCGVGDVDHARKHHVVLGIGLVEDVHEVADVGCTELAHHLGQLEYLVSGVLYGAGLMAADILNCKSTGSKLPEDFAEIIFGIVFNG